MERGVGRLHVIVFALGVEIKVYAECWAWGRWARVNRRRPWQQFKAHQSDCRRPLSESFRYRRARISWTNFGRLAEPVGRHPSKTWYRSPSNFWSHLHGERPSPTSSPPFLD